MSKKVKKSLNKKVDLNKEIDLDKEVEPYGMIYGLMIGSAVGVLLTLVFEVDMGFIYGIGPGMLIGIIIDCCRDEKKPKKNRKKKSTK